MSTVRMREQTFLILTALAAAPLHGYGIMKRVAELSGEQIKLGAGTLYGALDRLAEAGWVAIEREVVENGRLRRYYRLTEAGTTALEHEAARREELARSVRQWLSARPIPCPSPERGGSS